MRNEKPSPREILSKNLKSLMGSRPELSTIKKVADASDSVLSNGKVGRIYAASHTTDIDALQHLADVFGLQPWQLLVDGLNPKALPRLADAAVLNQILDAVAKKGAIAQVAHQVKPLTEELGPALTRAKKTKGLGTRGSAGKSVGVQKPQGRRRS